MVANTSSRLRTSRLVGAPQEVGLLVRDVARDSCDADLRKR